MYPVALAVSLALSLTASVCEAQSLSERLRGMSIEAEVRSSYSSRSPAGDIYTDGNIRTFKIYISTKGRIFDFSSAGDPAHPDSSAQIVQFGQKWIQGLVGQEWRTAGQELIRTRIYPWGTQQFAIVVDPGMTRCRINGSTHSTRADEKFFFFGHDNQPVEVASQIFYNSVCAIKNGNVYSDQK